MVFPAVATAVSLSIGALLSFIGEVNSRKTEKSRQDALNTLNKYTTQFRETQERELRNKLAGREFALAQRSVLDRNAINRFNLEKESQFESEFERYVKEQQNTINYHFDQEAEKDFQYFNRFLQASSSLAFESWFKSNFQQSQSLSNIPDLSAPQTAAQTPNISNGAITPPFLGAGKKGNDLFKPLIG